MEKKNQHLGDLILNCFRTRPDNICQIDAATSAQETNASVLSRSIQLANSLRAIGLVPGDVLALSGRNHLDLRIPYYAALFNGLPTVGVDPTYKFGEIKLVLKLASPKIAFCEAEDYEKYVRAAQELQLPVKIVSFGDGEHGLKAFLLQHQTPDKEEDFEVVELDPTKSYIWLITTSGTTSFAKLCAFTHEVAFAKTAVYLRQIKPSDNSTVSKPALNLSPVQWVSGLFNGVGMPLLGQTIVQTSAAPTPRHIAEIINKYKPQQVLIVPNTLWQILKTEPNCDLTCFDSIILGGAKLPPDFLPLVKSKVRPDTVVVEMYGQTETLGPSLLPHPNTPVGSCGRGMPLYEIQLADPETGTVLTGPNVTGELLVKGKIFTKYYNSPEETQRAFTKDGWYKTGDLLFRDESDNYYFVERIKMVIKSQGYHIVPKEIEDVIRNHKGVEEVVVVGIPHPADIEHAVACVVPKEGATVTAEEINQLVANSLSENKKLRGGVLFLKELPLSSTMKISLAKLKEIAQNSLKPKDTVQ